MWNGFMQMVHTNDEHPGKCTVIPLPMIDMAPSDPSCILSTLKFIIKQAKEYGHHAIVTFDQPLFWKALMILMYENDMDDIILILGQFHALMSFLGCIGYLMTGSGLDAILKLVYAHDVVPHMLSGKAVSRAIRGHLLVAAALYGLLVSKIYDVPILSDDTDDNMFPNINNPALQNISQLFDDAIAGSAIESRLKKDLNLVDLQNRINLYNTSLSDSKTA